jgi:hypothetical protein
MPNAVWFCLGAAVGVTVIVSACVVWAYEMWRDS